MRRRWPLPFSSSVTAGVSRLPSPVKATMASARADPEGAGGKLARKRPKPIAKRTRRTSTVASKRRNRRRGRFEPLASVSLCFLAITPSNSPLAILARSIEFVQRGDDRGPRRGPGDDRGPRGNRGQPEQLSQRQAERRQERNGGQAKLVQAARADQRRRGQGDAATGRH